MKYLFSALLIKILFWVNKECVGINFNWGSIIRGDSLTSGNKLMVKMTKKELDGIPINS